MSLRPRYSLLTLLILTTLVAGGVKLWYGPHHVVEQAKPGIEFEYTYTRNWRGDKIIHGPYIGREYGKQLYTVIWSYQHGILQDFSCHIFPTQSSHESSSIEVALSEWTPDIEEVYRPSMEKEVPRFTDQGVPLDISWSWGFDPECLGEVYLSN